ncbi:glycine cleavage system aminomethyltransferase GcvT [Amnibacterium setariae]|uniref:Aminomethyltransferase n=1 Tax=Amnibacterium setariae TaxID=2306585 RepID=A0A3A1U635_9MICO|nr:glycine cleavage system aminomethyltransferase GcvT [Amnibacterium setariae]RIX30917.1 glycine cleavage system aminomethyltransferase GcvT [Amnibacterium setariae]
MTDPSPRRSPLHDVHAAAGAAFTEFGGWTMPLRYSGDLAEHAAVRRAAGLFDLSHMAEILVLGPGAADALDAALLGELSTVAVGRAKYTLLLNGEGGVVDDLVVYRTGEDRYLVVANAANRDVVVDRLRDRVVGFDAAVQDETDEVGLIAIQGPRAEEILLEVPAFAVADDADPTEQHFRESIAALRGYRFLRALWDGHPVLVARTGYTGEDGFELYAAPELLPRLWTVLMDLGRGAGLVPAGLAARDTLRLEAGMPLYGHELTPLTTPQQAGLGRLVRRDKAADYVGRAAVEAPEAEGERVLVGLAAEGRRAARAGYPVLAGDREVGVVTSGVLSPTLGHPVAMAYVDRPATGEELAVDVRGSRLPVTTVPLPFYSRKA